MTEAELNDDFVDLLEAFDEAGVEFVVVGAHALAAHGHPRATGDLDVFVNPTAENATRVFRALEAFGAPLAAHGIRAADFAADEMVYQMGLPPRRIDLLTTISGVTFEEARATQQQVSVQGLTFPVIGRAMLVRNKRAAARPKDLLDVDLLEKSR